MTKPAITTLLFDNPRGPGVSIEVLSFAELLRKAPADLFIRSLRPTFHQVLVPTQGRVAYEVDFQRHALDRRAVGWAQPGQVQRLGIHAGASGWLLMFTADVLDVNGTDGSWDALGPRIDVGASGADIRWLLERMHRLSAEPDVPATRPVLRHLLLALLFMLRRVSPVAGDADRGGERDVFSLFRREVDRRFARTRRLADYERVLGYSSKTLGRAVQAATGMTAKSYVDQRVLLEAQRLLAHTRMGVGEIATELGFTELTNFVKFFRREAKGESPAAFRARVR